MYRVARQIEKRVAGLALTEVWFAYPELNARAKELHTSSIAGVRTLGKALLIEFESGHTIYTHNQLYGRWLFSTPDRRPDTRRQLRLALSTPQHSALLYSASDIDLIDPGQLPHHPFIRRAGLDVLSSGAEVEEIERWLAKPQFSRRQLGHLLLDQSFLAGVGNYLRSEILFLARLHPSVRLKDMDDSQRMRLAEAVHLLMWRSVQSGGVTNDPERVAKLRAAGWKRRDYRHYVFGRAGQACFESGSAIVRTDVAGRRLYLSPALQSE
jgi:endonuclease-8